ncbi:MAG: family 16 glycosylhydrolase [Phycisphaeraceae bacterium]
MNRTACMTTRTLLTTLMIGSVGTIASADAPKVLLEDNFTGTGNVAYEAWRLPADGPAAFYGRTQAKVDPAIDTPQQIGGNAVLQLDTYFPDDPGAAFHGAEMISKRVFARGGGISMEWRSRIDLTTVPAGVGGLVNGLFSYNVTRTDTGGLPVRDELDWELLTNEIVNGNNRPFTNTYSEEGFVGPTGDAAFISPGQDLGAFHNYRIDWKRDRVEWYRDDVLVRTETNRVPDDPMTVRANLWATDSGFSDAFDNALQTAATLGANQEIEAQVDFIKVKELGAAFDANLSTTRRSDNLLVDPSHVAPLTSPDSNFVGGWQTFSNAFATATPSFEGVTAFDGDNAAAKFFGSFFSGGDSVLIQRVEEQEGQVFDGKEFEATVRMLTPSADGIVGTQNIALTVVQFFDESFNLITEPFNPAPGIALNGEVATIIDGRIATTPTDTWVESNLAVKAPVGTHAIEIVHVFVQTANNFENGFIAEGGAVWIDGNELVMLTDILDADMDGDVDVDDLDLVLMSGGDADSTDPIDINQDGSITSQDALDWLTEYGSLPGDTNLDGEVDLIDLSALASNFDTAGDGWATGDFNGDGVVDLIDLSTLASNFGNSASAVPEPASAVLLGLAALALRRR